MPRHPAESTPAHARNMPLRRSNLPLRFHLEVLEDRTVPTAIALLHADDPFWADDVDAKLEATGQFTSVTPVDVSFATPSLADLLPYDSVLVWNDFPFADPDAMGDVLADYVDAGRGVVVATFANVNSFTATLGGRWAVDGYDAIQPSDSEGFNPLTLGAVAQPGHPIMAGVTNFDGGFASWHSLGGLTPGSALVASWSDGSPLVAERSAQSVGLNFFPPSSDVYFEGWVSGTDGDLLMANALTYVTGFSASAASPAGGSVVFTQPTDFVINFSAPYNPATVAAGDLTVNGVAADSVTQTDADTLTFHFATTPVTTQGLQTIHMDAGAVEAASGDPVKALNATFRYDVTLMQVTSTNPAAGSTILLPATTLDLNFNEAYALASVQTSDFIVNQGTVASFTQVDADTVRLTLSGVTAEGTLTLTLPAGAMTDVYGNAGAAYSANYTLDFGTVPFPTPLTSLAPAGSLVYDGTQVGFISPAGDTDSFSILVDPGQKITVTVDPAATLRPVVELYRGSALLGSATAGSAGLEALLQSVATQGQIGVMGPGPTTYTVTVRGAGGTTGGYTVRMLLNAAVENESHDGAANNTRGTAQNLDAAFLTFNASVGSNQSSAFPGSAAVLGTLEGATLNVVDSDGFESGALDGQWATYSSAPQGRVRVTDEAGAASGTYALVMDRNPSGGNILNEAVWTVNLSGVTAPVLRFSHADFNDEETSLPANFTGHANGDGVSISADGVNWHRVLNATNVFGWQTVAIDLAAEAAAAGMTLGAGFQIKFQQFDNFPIFTDGRGYDDIAIGSVVRSQDFYSFSLKAGESVTLAMMGTAGLDLQNAAGTTLATAAAGPTNVNKVITDFVAPATGTYYARFSTPAGLSSSTFAPSAYTLVVTRNAAFDAEANSTIGTAQPLVSPQVAGRQWVQGALTREGYTAAAVPFGFTDISGTGTPVLQGTDDDVWGLGAADLNGFTFSFYGQDYATLSFSTNGLITLGGFNGSFTNTNLTSSPPGASIAVLWNDLETFSNSGAVYWQVLGSGASQQLVVQWNEVGYYAFNPGTITFQAILSEADGSIRFNYLDLDGGAFQNEGASATVGIKAPGFQGPDRILLAFNNGPNEFLGTGKSTVIGPAPASDFYRITATAGGTIRLDTMTPARSAGAFVNVFDPLVRLYTSAGTLVASNDNGAPDGRNASLNYTVPAGGSGTYYIEVTNSRATAVPTFGEYILTVKGNTAGSAQTLDGGFAGGTGTSSRLTTAALQGAYGRAITYWAAQGVDTSSLGAVDLRIDDMADGMLGYAFEGENAIVIDDDGAGRGWSFGPGGALGAVDLDEVVTHEVGHLLGFEHDHDDDVMRPTLSPIAQPPEAGVTERASAGVVPGWAALLPPQAGRDPVGAALPPAPGFPATPGTFLPPPALITTSLVVDDEFAFVIPVDADSAVVFNGSGDQPKSAPAPTPGARSAVAVAIGDVTGDGVPDIVTGAGAGGGPHVKVFDGVTRAEVRSFDAYDPAFTGGVTVRTRDVDGDGRVDIATGPGPGGGSRVRVFSGVDSRELVSLFAGDLDITRNVADGDFTGDGVAELVVAAGAGDGPRVRVRDRVTGAVSRDFFAYDVNFRGGVNVAVGDLTGDGVPDIVTGAGAGGGPHVKVFDGVTGAEVRSFYAYDPSFTGGVSVAIGDVTGDGVADIVTGAGRAADRT